MFENAVVHPEARIEENVSVGPFCYIEKDVVIGSGTIIEPNVTIYNGSVIGKNCHIYPGTVIGAPAQDLSYAGEKTTVEIGNNVTIRESCTIHRGTKDKWKTVVGDNCFLMAYAHIAHDCVIGKNCILANAVNLGGHVEVGEFTNIGGMVPVHQFSKIGKHAMIAGGVTIRKDVPHYVKVGRDPASFIGVNTIGLSRKGFEKSEIRLIEDIYRMLFVKHRNIKKAVKVIEDELPDNIYKKEILEFIQQSKRGLIKGL